MTEKTLDNASQDLDGLPAAETPAQDEPGERESQAAQEKRSAELPAVTLRTIRAALRQVEGQLLQVESQLRIGIYPESPVTQPLTTKQIWLLSVTLLTALFVVGVRLFRLNTLQLDLYGDIQIVHQFVSGVRSGTWPFEYVLGVGPIYHYVIQPVIWLTGLNYYGLKLSAVLVSLGALLATYGVARRLIDESFALLAVVIAGASSWLLIFSRLGISLILSPLLVTCAIWLMMRIIQDRKPTDVIACAVVSALGMYAYPQVFILPIVSFLTLVCLRWLGHPISSADLRRFLIFSVLGALPFVWMFYKWPEGFTQGYIGSKFLTEGDPFRPLIRNIVATALAYHVKGDSIFRSNPNYLPHLDPISGLLFLAGVVFWLRPARRRWSPLLLVPFVLLHLPSVLVLDRPSEVPNAGRTLGIAPIVYILVASGIWWLVHFFTRVKKRRVGLAIAGLLLTAVVVLNMQRYFGAYINGLPYHDISIGGEIASYADTLPPETQVYVVGCCWEGAMPELPFIQMVATRPQNLHGLDPKNLTCEQLESLSEPAVLVWTFHDPLPAVQLTTCKQWLPAQLYMSRKGWPVYYAAPLLKDSK